VGFVFLDNEAWVDDATFMHPHKTFGQEEFIKAEIFGSKDFTPIDQYKSRVVALGFQADNVANG
jgi:hypothetical protein